MSVLRRRPRVSLFVHSFLGHPDLSRTLRRVAWANGDFIKKYSISEINPQEETHTIGELRGKLLLKGFVQHNNYELQAHPFDRPNAWVVADDAEPISNFHLTTSYVFNVRLN
ncbi:hypothetical protein Ddc_21422 [Ditylenchus destructor]|nr:hypothetical protein Ddc_21422 [Ditylenchus destructor]